MAVIEMVASFTNSPLFVPTVAAGSAAVGIMAYKKMGGGPTFEGELLKEAIQGEIKDVTDVWGHDLKKTARYGMAPIGVITDAQMATVAIEMDRDLDVDGENDEDADDEQDRDDEDQSPDVEEFLMMQVRPSGLFPFIGWKITDDMLSMSRSTKYVAVPRKFVEDGEDLVISRNWQPTKIGGVWTSDNRTGASFARAMTFKGIMERTLKTGKDVVRAVSEMNIRHVQNIQEMEIAGEIEKNKYSSDVGDVLEGE